MTVHSHPWFDAQSQAVAVFRASLHGQIAWPSGRTTTTMLASTAVMSNLEAHASVYGPEHVRQAKEANARASITSAATRAADRAAQGWWIRARKRGRQRARRINGLVWV